MVGIVLTSHGGFADGINQSAEMIFGQQQDVAHVILKPDEGPDDIHAKLENAIKDFSDQEQVLFLVDLWGGTPFNQASSLFEKHQDTWAIVTGMNLPMVIEALASRMTMNSAREIATHIVETAKDGIKTLPEELMPKTKEPAAPASAKPAIKGAIPEGTVIGDGKIKYVLARVDSRLLHGQAAPTGVHANTVPIAKMIKVDKDPRFGDTRAMLLFETPEDALRAIEGGVGIKELNIGSMAYSEGKVNVNQVLAMNQEDVDTFRKLKQLGIKFIVKKVPSSNAEDMDALLDKAQKLIDEQKK